MCPTLSPSFVSFPAIEKLQIRPNETIHSTHKWSCSPIHEQALLDYVLDVPQDTVPVVVSNGVVCCGEYSLTAHTEYSNCTQTQGKDDLKLRTLNTQVSMVNRVTHLMCNGTSQVFSRIKK